VLLENIPAWINHNGCRLLFSPSKRLWITSRDAGKKLLAQDKSSLSGKILRINTDGSIPTDNPFPNSPIWSFGHRNPQGLVYAKDKLYSTEHCTDIEDEVNINYGWPNVQGECDGNEKTFCSQNNVAQSLYSWTPTIAVCGLEFYNSDYIPQWKNSLLMATLNDQTLY
jgi:glucose/arabinose dehydrogenase